MLLIHVFSSLKRHERFPYTHTQQQHRLYDFLNTISGRNKTEHRIPVCCFLLSLISSYQPTQTHKTKTNWKHQQKSTRNFETKNIKHTLRFGCSRAQQMSFGNDVAKAFSRNVNWSRRCCWSPLLLLWLCFFSNSQAILVCCYCCCFYTPPCNCISLFFDIHKSNNNRTHTYAAWVKSTILLPLYFLLKNTFLHTHTNTNTIRRDTRIRHVHTMNQTPTCLLLILLRKFFIFHIKFAMNSLFSLFI